MQRNLAAALANSSRTRSAPQTSISKHDAATALANALRDHAIGSREFRNASEALEFLSLEGVCAPLHFVTSSQGQCRRKGDIEAHLLSTQVSSDSFFELTKSCLVCSPELAFVQCADRRADFIWLLELGYELCGTYQTERTGLTTQYEVEALTSTQRIRDFLKRNPSLRGSRLARRALLYMSDGSASPRETALALLLGLPRHLGGYGLEIPLMNHPVKLNDQSASIAQRALLRCDLCWPKFKVDVEYQSDFAHQGELDDNRRYKRGDEQHSCVRCHCGSGPKGHAKATTRKSCGFREKAPRASLEAGTPLLKRSTAGQDAIRRNRTRGGGRYAQPAGTHSS